MWSTTSHLHLATLQGHTGWITALAIGKGKLYSGGADNTVRVWDAYRHIHLANLEGHTQAVCSLLVVGTKVFSGSGDQTVQVWDSRTYCHLACLEGHGGCVSTLVLADNKIYSTDADGDGCYTIRVWGLDRRLSRMLSRVGLCTIFLVYLAIIYEQYRENYGGARGT